MTSIKKTVVRAGAAFAMALGLALLPVLPASAATATINSQLGMARDGAVHWATKRTHLASGVIAFKGDPTSEMCGTSLSNRLRSGSSSTSTVISNQPAVTFDGVYKNWTKANSTSTTFAAGTVFYITSIWYGAACFYPMEFKGTLKY